MTKRDQQLFWKKMDKKGLAVGQVFIFILAILTFAVIMIFGYKMINSFLKSGEDVGYVQFKTDVESSVKRIYTEFGSVRVETFHVPARYEQVCFVDMNYPNIDREKENLCAWDVVACSVWEDALEARRTNPSDIEAGYNAIDTNVFLTPDGPKIKVYKITLRDEAKNPMGFLCLPIRGGSFSVRLEGKGSHTEISPAVVE